MDRRSKVRSKPGVRSAAAATRTSVGGALEDRLGLGQAAARAATA